MEAIRTIPFNTRYQVLDTVSLNFIPDCFILFPVSDLAAILAIKTYITTMEGNDFGRQALIEWIIHLESVHKEFKEMEKYDDQDTEKNEA